MTDITDFPKMCGVYLLKQDGSIVIEGTNYEPSGPGGLSSNIRCRLSRDLVQKHLGKWIVEICNETKVVRGGEVDDKEYMKQLLYFCGERKSYKNATSKMDYLSVSIKSDVVTVRPSVYDPKYGGYSYIKDLPEIECCLNENNITLTVLSAFESILEYKAL